MEQRVRNAAEVRHRQVVHGHVGTASPELDVADGRCRNGPEEPTRIWVDSRIEVVDLGREILEVILTSVEVQSNEAERTFVDRSIHSDVDATHETHVGIEKQSLGASVGIRCRAGALHVRDPNETVEIPDR